MSSVRELADDTVYHRVLNDQAVPVDMFYLKLRRTLPSAEEKLQMIILQLEHVISHDVIGEELRLASAVDCSV